MLPFAALRKLIMRMFQPGICETTPGVKSYSGYVHLPAGFLDDGSGQIQNYPVNTYVHFDHHPLSKYSANSQVTGSSGSLRHGKIPRRLLWRYG